jgi:hypothetical protein
MKKLSERTARLTIGMMRSMANCKPISPFHLNASHEMEQLLKEVLEYRKANNDRARFKHMGEDACVEKAADDHQTT